MEHKYLGTSLISVLLGMALSTLVASGAFYWYQFTKKHYIREREHFTQRDIRRTLFRFLEQDLFTSGYKGCRSRDEFFPVKRGFIEKKREEYLFPKDRRIVFGFFATEETCFEKMPNTICKRIVPNTDLLIIYDIPKRVTTLTTDLSSPSDSIKTEQNSAVSPGSLVLISDCLQGDLFLADAVKGDLIFHQAAFKRNASNALSKCYLKGSEVAELQRVAYYLGISNRFKTHKMFNSDRSFYALYRDDLLQAAEEVVDGIISFKVEFGIFMLETQELRYQSTVQVEDWLAVQCVRIKIKTLNMSTFKEESWELEVALRNR